MWLILCVISVCTTVCAAPPIEQTSSDSPRIINIINFIRQTDYRIQNSDQLLYETVVEQIKLLKQYSFPATFLLQYDALINPLYQQLLKSQLDNRSEVGAWWEITQPHVEAAGLKWRGEHSWVSHANIAFTTGYSPEEREKLVDVYMSKFKEIFGYYPKSVGSWYVDSHSLAYMYEKYGIVASCNCKDQIGTDGYTLWGGYWNQAYYPSRTNAYMPAQTREGQIPVPIFRMLGSDPIYQYEMGLGGRRQGVISLEPVYPESGMNKRWVEYFLRSIVDEPCLAFNYAQAGQENSFTWAGMKQGLQMQFPLFEQLLKQGKIRIETLEHSGRWFSAQFSLTPATAITTMEDVRNEGRKSVWYNSRFYRANLLWEGDSFRFRDIHLFDERVESAYYRKKGEGNQFFYYTLPLVDGFNWSTISERAGLRIFRTDGVGIKTEVSFGVPNVKEEGRSAMIISCKDSDGNLFSITLRENQLEVACQPVGQAFEWGLELRTSKGAELPFQKIETDRITASFLNYDYMIRCLSGTAVRSADNDGSVFFVKAEKDRILFNMVQDNR